MSNDSTAVDFGINLLEEEIDDVIFRTNEFLTDATFTGGQGPFWWLLVVVEFMSRKFDFIRCKSATCKFLSRDTKSARDKNGTKPRKIKVRTLCSKYPLRNTSVSIAKVHICPLINEGISLFLSLSTHIPTFVL